MSWLRKKHDAVSMTAASVLLTVVTLAAVWDELSLLVLAPPLLLAPLGLFPAWFVWAWTMFSKGYIRSISPASAISVTLLAGPIFWFVVLKLARSQFNPDPKAVILVALILVFTAAFLLPQRRVD